MALVFTVQVVNATAGLAAAMPQRRTASAPRRGLRGVTALVAWVSIVYLLAGFAYGEPYPCLAVNRFCCDIAGEPYRNLFGWEFRRSDPCGFVSMGRAQLDDTRPRPIR